jgi:hypothetical protein
MTQTPAFFGASPKISEDSAAGSCHQHDLVPEPIQNPLAVLVTPKATQNATLSDRQARALRIAYDCLAAELKKAKRGEAATVTLRRARSAMNAIPDVLHGMRTSPSRKKRTPPGISRGELARSVLRDLRESGAW